MKKEKPSVEATLRQEIAELKDNVSRGITARRELQDILDQLSTIINPTTEEYVRTGNTKLLREVMKLASYRNIYEGAVREERETIERLTAIIRWQISPATADQSKQLEELRKGRGY